MGKKKLNTIKHLYGTSKKSLYKRGAIILGMLSVVIVFITYYGQNVGSFSIRLDEDMQDRQIYLSTDPSFAWKDSRLEAESLSGASTTSLPYVDSEVSRKTDGSYIGTNKSYISYSFFISNESNEKMEIEESLRIIKAKGELENYAWVWYFDGEEDTSGSVYHKKDTEEVAYYDYPELNEFEDEATILRKRISMAPKEVKRITIIMWVEDNDPDLKAAESITGALRITLLFSAVKEELA